MEMICMAKIGLQLYSIKELTQKDFIGTLKKVAETGYEGVEFAGFFNTPAKELKKALDDFGLKCCGSHTGINLLTDNIEETLQYNLEIGNPYIICPGVPETMRNGADAYKRLADLFNKIGEKCKEHNLQFGYHNHSAEFKIYDGQYGLDILLDNTDPDLVQMELDTFWAEYAGVSSVDFMKRHPKHCATLIHIKDMKSKEEKVNTEIGKGVMDFVTITKLAKELGIKWYIVEQEEFEIPQLESIKQSLQYLKEIL